MPKVSVIIPTYNRTHYVCEAIDSVLSQTFKDLEVIVVDDGSTDDARQVLENYSSRIYYIYQENRGRSEARNKGIKAAKGEYIAFLDDDDIWLPYKLERQVQFLDAHPDIGLVNTFTEVVDEHGHILGQETKQHLQLYKKAIHIGYTYEGMSKLCVMFISSVVLRKECVDTIGVFDSHAEALEDWDLYLRLALKYRIGIIPEPLIMYRQHQSQTSRNEFIRGRINVALKHLALLDSNCDSAYGKGIRYNFYMHLANAYYMDRQFRMFRTYALKALKSNPLALLRSRLGIHLLVTMLPAGLVKKI